MDYHIAAIRVTFGDLQGHSCATASFSKSDFFFIRLSTGRGHWLESYDPFLPARRQRCAGTVLAIIRLSVCLCDTSRYCIKTAKRRITQTTPRDSPGNLVFRRQNSLVDNPLFPLKYVLKVTNPLQKPKFRPIFAHRASTVRAGKKSSISTNRKSITRFPTSHR